MSTNLEGRNSSGSRASPLESSRQTSFKGLSSSLLTLPLNVLNSVAMNGVSVLRPYTRYLVPIFVCLILIPIAVCLSLFAGWRVWRSLPVGWEVPLYLQYGQRTVPYALTAIPTVHASQPYDISVHITLPVSDANMALGNFMTTLTLVTPSNRTIASTSRPALVLPPKSSWIFGVPKTITLDMTLFSSFVPKTSDILAYVEIGRQDGWRSVGDGRGRDVSVLSAALRGHEIPRGIRGLAIRFPLIASSLAACIFLLILCLMIGTCILPTVFSVPTAEAEAEHRIRDKKKIKSEPSSSHMSKSRVRSSSTPLRRRRSQIARRLSGSSRAVISKAERNTDETPVTLIPTSTNVTETTPEVSSRIAGPSGIGSREKLRRRMSRPLEESDDGHEHSGTEAAE